MPRGPLALFALNADRDFADRVARQLDTSLAEHEERNFEDGEHKIRPLCNVRDRDVFVVQSLYTDAHYSVDDKLCRLLFFLGALRDASAGRLTAVIPHLCYARKDRRTKPRDPVTTRYVAQMLECVGVDRIVGLDVHNAAAFDNAFRCRADHLEARGRFVEHFTELARREPVTVVSPDAGGVKRAEAFRQALSRASDSQVPIAFMEKQRSEGVVSGEAFVGPVEGRTAIIVDDLISSGTTLRRTAAACKDRGAKAAHAAATHGLFTGAANEAIGDPALDGVVITDTIPPFRLDPGLVQRKLTVLDVTGLIADAIHRIHTAGSIVELMRD